MNTDQAFELLRSAGVPDEKIIQIVRRWLREHKIKYAGNSSKANRKFEDTDQVIELLKDAGVEASTGLQIVQQWFHEGKIRKIGNREHINDYLSGNTTAHLIVSDQEKTVRELRVKLKAQDEHIKGMEEFYKHTIKELKQQREKLHKEIAELQNEKSLLQKETRRVLKENIELRNELLRLKENYSRQGKEEDEKKSQTVSPSTTPDYRRKLGLSKTAGEKEILAKFKKLLLLTHPDHGGNAAAFHYVKTDYDQYKNSLKGK
ncbi:hypothetical protein LRS37_02220 [Neobacillus sedimentimangrovi]|uniref:J domain-containing protein n=1 Tax=Neobacillus sedimentimangrovi TaxID=2699460 RepID=A0ABS8QEN6_9BACI|nr:hypothetical protein [Neobacillus sedimentimangrovi]MCD4837712.1 hypothetical protein [Neobacillus sedimentimangrovi]